VGSKTGPTSSGTSGRLVFCPSAARRRQDHGVDNLTLAGLTRASPLAAPIIIKGGRPDCAKIEIYVLGSRCRRMTTAPSLARPCRCAGMGNIPINTIFTIGRRCHSYPSLPTTLRCGCRDETRSRSNIRPASDAMPAAPIRAANASSMAPVSPAIPCSSFSIPVNFTAILRS